MLRNKSFLLLILIVCFSFVSEVFSQTTTLDLSERYLEKAEAAFEDGQITEAFKNITMAMKVTKTSEYDVVPANVLVLARTIYRQKLKQLQKLYNAAEFIELKTNLETYSEVETSEIKKLVRQIENSVVEEEKASDKRDQQEFYNKLQESSNAVRESTEAILETADATSTAVTQMVEENRKQAERAEARDVKNDKKFTMIFIVIIGIALIILIVVMLIIVVVRAAARHSQLQQQQYAEAFKLLAQNQSQTNQLMIGGIAGLYGDDGLKLAGSSTWSQSALPEPEETPEEKEELRELAVKCEDLGAKIDQVTGRKNNSKNVSELVYKLALRLGVRQHEAMVYFCASMVYDAGFLGIDEELLKEENLTDEQRKELNKHTALSEEHLQFIPKRYWSVFDDAARFHHENMDGSGMPDGLKGDDIPKVARIIRVADSFNALSSRRTYRGGIDKESAVAKLEEQPNIYDQDVINALKDII